MPTKDNLVRRGVLQDDDHFCIEDCGEMESINHLFLHCSIFSSHLYLVCGWLGFFFFVDPHSVSNHFIHYVILTSGSKARRSLMHLFWFSTMWVI